MPTKFTWNKQLNILILLTLAALMWNMPAPEGLSIKAWRLSIIFITTIITIILNLLPMGAILFFSIACCVVTQTLT